MNPLYSSIYIDDLKLCLNEYKDLLLKLKDKSILITGASGLICSALVDLLLLSNKENNTNIKVYACGRNVDKLNSRFLTYFNDDNFYPVNYNADQTNAFNFKVDYILHAASNAYPGTFAKEPVETMVANFNGLLELLNYGKQINCQCLLYVSSSEVYGINEKGGPYSEEDYGYLNLLSPRSCYPSSKRASETLCVSYAQEYELKTVIARPGHIYGPTASEKDNRVSSAFAYKVAKGEDISLNDGTPVRSYCYVLDCATALLTILLKGENGNAYNISNPNSIMSISDICAMFAKEGNVKLSQAETEEKEKAYFNPMKDSSLKSNKLEALDWKALFDKEAGPRHTVRVIKEILGVN